jgi:RNA polymerase sigma-70 factor (ECF subfamily)
MEEGSDWSSASRSKPAVFRYPRCDFSATLAGILDMPDSVPESDAVAPRVFATTHWSVVLAAGQGESAPAQRALETLCRAYWFPIYAYVRRKGYRPEEAQDLTQEFFAQLIAKDHFRLADRNKGKFRGFLLAALDYFLAREWSRAHRQKRGGQFTFISMDEHPPEERYQLEPADHETPETKFLRHWALTVLKQAMNALETECKANGKALLFREAKNLISGERDRAAYGQMGRSLHMAEGAVRVAVHRLRQRYGELLRSEVAHTVTREEEVDEELRYLFQVLRPVT